MVKPEYVVEDWSDSGLFWLAGYDRSGTIWSPHIHEAKLVTEKEAQLLLMTHCRNNPGAAYCKLSEVAVCRR